MKPHTQEFKEIIKNLGRQQDILIEYTIDNTAYTLTVEDVNSITPVFESCLLKSVMKELDLDCDIRIPEGTEINFKWGLYVNGAVEYLNYGKYIVYSCEKQEDSNSYSIICYDKLLRSMKEYEAINLVYPITIREYLTALANQLGLEFKNSNDTFANYNKEITNDLFANIGYTYRDVLDDLAEVTASVICLDDDGKLELRNINNTNDTINEEYLKDANVNFSETFGPVNSIVLSRSSSDNVYMKDDTSITANGLCEIKIIDNQIMNFNDRSDYLEDIYNKLHGLTYTIFDISSTGVMYYDLLDRFNIQIGDVTYSCILFNDEQNITQGLEETMYAVAPQTSQTDYTKADKTDQKINQTNLIVNKQEQEITAVVEQIGDRSEKSTTITQDIDTIQSKVNNIQDLTREVSGIKTITLENAMAGELLSLRIKGNNTVFSYLYPADNLYPSNDLYPKGDSKIIFNEEVYDLGITEALRQNGQVCDEYILEDGQAKIIRRINSDGTIKTTEETEDLGEFNLNLQDGLNSISIMNYNAEITAKYVIQSDYTDVFATKVEMNSSITQTAEEINLKVSKKVGEDEIISKINQTAESITIDANRININGTVSANGNFKVDTNGNMECNNGTFNGGKVILIDTSGVGNEFQIVSGFNNNSKTMIGSSLFTMKSNALDPNGANSIYFTTGTETGEADIGIIGPNNQRTIIKGSGITTPNVTQTSLEETKKNISKVEENALEIVKNAEIYNYNLKPEKDTDKKHYGFVIGEKYKTPKEVIASSGEGIDIYSMCSILWKAVQEQQKQIEELKEGK